MLAAHDQAVEAVNGTTSRGIEARLSAEALQKAIVNSATFSSIATDVKGVIQIFNAGAERMLGYSAGEVINRLTPADLSDPQELRARSTALSLEFLTPVAPGFDTFAFKASRGIEDIHELTYRRKDGGLVPAVVSVTALRDAQDAVIGYLLIGTDNTARRNGEDAQRSLDQQREVEEMKRFEQVLQQKNAELEHANRMKSEFLARMSHELRTPLNAILGFSEMLRDGLIGDLSEHQRGFIGDIFNSGQHLLSVINDILDLSKVEAGKTTLELESVELPELFSNSLSIIRERAAARTIRIVTDIADDPDSFHADRRKLKQIVYNLLSNAVKYTRDGGQVTVRTGRVPRAAVGDLNGSWHGRSIPLAASEFAEFLQVSVTDSGIGISPDGLEKLFKPFSQVDSALGREFEGTGLGLVMVKLLAELHGGTVAVESEVGEGSCFTVWLPLRAPTASVPAQVTVQATRPIPVRANASTALVVDDDFKSAHLIRMQLEAEGFNVLHAASAEAALVLAVQQPLSLITLDVMLPNMDGWEFLGRLKQVPNLQGIPVLIISIVADQKKGLALGAAAVMQKPFSRRELYRSLVDLGLFPLSQAQTLKVLVVDDDPDEVEQIAVRILGVAGDVVRANGGAEAIDIARKEQPDLIVLDLLMPEVDGYRVVAELKSNPVTAHIPVLVVSAKEITAADRALLDHDVVAIMGKAEFDRDRFIAEVRRSMSWRRTVA